METPAQLRFRLLIIYIAFSQAGENAADAAQKSFSCQKRQDIFQRFFSKIPVSVFQNHQLLLNPEDQILRKISGQPKVQLGQKYRFMFDFFLHHQKLIGILFPPVQGMQQIIQFLNLTDLAGNQPDDSVGQA